MQKDFKCQNCHYFVKIIGNIGTKNRNHCPKCLFSKHVDDLIVGDRISNCKALMEPIGFTFKNVGLDKYGNQKQGELMIVHKCINKKCNKISINRIAGDDDSETIMNLFEKSLENKYSDLREIIFLTQKDREEIKRQLFGE